MSKKDIIQILHKLKKTEEKIRGRNIFQLIQPSYRYANTRNILQAKKSIGDKPNKHFCKIFMHILTNHIQKYIIVTQEFMVDISIEYHQSV